MKRNRKSTVFILLVLILCFAATALFGVSNYYGDIRTTYFKGAEDIRWGVDISGGVEAVFAPDLKGVEITDSDMDAAKQIIADRMVSENITDSEIYVDYTNKQIIVRFPWQAGDTTHDPSQTVDKLGKMALLTFRAGDNDAKGKVIIQGSQDILSASAQYNSTNQQHYVLLKLTEQGKTKFAAGTKENKGGKISIYMDDLCISSPNVDEEITNGEAVISGSFTLESATELANQINGGTLPFAMKPLQTNVIAPTYGESALSTMLIAGIIAFALICVIMIALYRVPGIISCVCLLGQVAGIIACTSGYFPSFSSYTLTVPGIAGIILSIGMGVDANVITNERIKEELRKGKTVEGAVRAGYKNAWSAILDGNATNIIVALVLMAAFGSPDSFLTKIFSGIFFFLGTSTTGSIYSFGVTLLIGAIWNFIMGIGASRLMMTSLVSNKVFRNPKLYGGVKNVEKV